MKLLRSVLIPGLAAVSFACVGQASTKVPNTIANPTPTPTNVEKTAAAATPTIEVGAPGSLATPADTYRTACAVRKKKDVAGMKRILSKEVIAHLTTIGEGGGKALDEEIAQMFKIAPPKKVATRNEKINGDRSTIEYLLDEGAWKKLYFIKEGADWKYALPAKGEMDYGSVTDNGER